ncbi:hypothetical protein DXA42_00005 [Bifidobacterium pseudocatenulatum]|nr:hypothetical protein DXA42_00005 [Bifidobacterium pseudocatenulatum]
MILENSRSKVCQIIIYQAVGLFVAFVVRPDWPLNFMSGSVNIFLWLRSPMQSRFGMGGSALKIPRKKNPAG